MESLKCAKAAAVQRQAAALAVRPAGDGRQAELGQQLRTAQASASSAKAQLDVLNSQTAAAEDRLRKAETNGSRRVAKLREALEELWRSLAAQKRALGLADN